MDGVDAAHLSLAANPDFMGFLLANVAVVLERVWQRPPGMWLLRVVTKAAGAMHGVRLTAASAQHYLRSTRGRWTPGVSLQSGSVMRCT